VAYYNTDFSKKTTKYLYSKKHHFYSIIQTNMNPVLAFNLKDIQLGQNSGTLGGSYATTSSIISIILKTSITVASIIFLGLLIFGGISFIMNAGSGDPKKAGQGQAAITNALIGFAIVLLAYTIIQIIEVITGLNILNPNL